MRLRLRILVLTASLVADFLDRQAFFLIDHGHEFTIMAQVPSDDQ